MITFTKQKLNKCNAVVMNGFNNTSDIDCRILLSYFKTNEYIVTIWNKCDVLTDLAFSKQTNWNKWYQSDFLLYDWLILKSIFRLTKSMASLKRLVHIFRSLTRILYNEIKVKCLVLGTFSNWKKSQMSLIWCEENTFCLFLVVIVVISVSHFCFISVDLFAFDFIVLCTIIICFSDVANPNRNHCCYNCDNHW
jgi:hypothetical protein